MALKNNWAAGDTVAPADLNAVADAVNGAPYDVCYVQTLGTRAVGFGENSMGIKFQRAATLTSVTFRCGTADASGNLVVSLRKNGSLVTGTSATIASGSQVAGGTLTGIWLFSANDILTVYTIGVGTSPGNGLVADIRGMLA